MHRGEKDMGWECGAPEHGLLAMQDPAASLKLTLSSRPPAVSNQFSLPGRSRPAVVQVSGRARGQGNAPRPCFLFARCIQGGHGLHGGVRHLAGPIFPLH